MKRTSRIFLYGFLGLTALCLVGAVALTPAVDAQPKKPVPAKKWGKKPIRFGFTDV